MSCKSFSIAVFAFAAAFGQSLTFEVASVRPSAPVPPQGGVYFGPARGGPGTPDPTHITWSYPTLRTLLMTAYDLSTYQLSGPAWLDTERYDVVVKVPPGSTKEQVNVMWQNLLTERFGIQLHHESREFQVQELVAAKGGPKLKGTSWDTATPLPPGPPQNDKAGGLTSPGVVMSIFPGATVKAHVVAKAQPMSRLATMLGNDLRRPVLDKTGLTGTYDFVLDYAINLPGFAPPPGAEPAGATDPGPDMSAAIEQQLGLRLVSAKAQLDVVVIDKANKVPSEN